MRALLVSVVWLAGCAITPSLVREEAADDLGCPEEELSVRHEDEVFRVSGCGLDASYVCSRDGLTTASLCTRIALRGVRLDEQEPRVREKAAQLLECDGDALAVSTRDQARRYTAQGCGRRVDYECIARADCCAFTTPGAQPVDDRSESTSPRPVEPADAVIAPANPVRGKLSKRDIRAVIEAGIANVRACYEAVLVQRPTSAGVVVVQFVIAPDGHVQTAALSRSSLGHRQAEQCVVEATRRFRFPEPKGAGVVVVTYPYVFARDGAFAECL